MDKKHIIIIIVFILAIAVIGGYLFSNSAKSSENSIFELSKSAYMNIPKNPNATTTADKNGVLYYTDESNGINVTSISNISTPVGVSKMNSLKNSIERGSEKIIGDNVVVYLKDGIYSIFVVDSEYNDTILIQSKDKNLLLVCWESLKFHSPTDKLKFNDTDSGSQSSDSSSFVNGAEKAQSAVESSSSSTPSTSTSSSTTSASYSDSFGSSTGSTSRGSGGRSNSGPSYEDSF